MESRLDGYAFAASRPELGRSSTEVRGKVGRAYSYSRMLNGVANLFRQFFGASPYTPLKFYLQGRSRNHETAFEGAGNGSRKPSRKVGSSPGIGPPPEHAGEAARCHIQMLASTHPDQPARKWDLRRETLDDEWEAFERRLEQYGPLETESL